MRCDLDLDLIESETTQNVFKENVFPPFSRQEFPAGSTDESVDVFAIFNGSNTCE